MTLSRKSELKRTPFRRAEPKPPSGPRKRKCAICREQFAPRSMTHKVCSQVCSEQFVAATKVKAERKADRERKQANKSRREWEADAQAAVNAWVRERDAHLPCISCGRWHDGQYHAGHYLSRGARPGLRYVEANIARQCMPCNVHLSGNQVNFRLGLIARIGIDAVEALEADDRPRKYSIEELRAIRDEYRSRLRALKAKQ